MWIAAARTAGDTCIAGELVLQPTDVGVLWRKLDWMLRALHLVDPHLRLAHRLLKIFNQRIQVGRTEAHPIVRASHIAPAIVAVCTKEITELLEQRAFQPYHVMRNEDFCDPWIGFA